MKKLLLLNWLWLLLPHGAGYCPPGAEVNLSYQDFDQSPGKGWRALADAGRYAEAAAMIEAYLSRHASLDQFQLANLHFHAGQALAFAGESEAALKHLESARLQKGPALLTAPWNEYVAATTAFLRRDRAGLVAARKRLAGLTPQRDEIPNLVVVDRLIRNFDLPYREAYKSR